MIGILKIVYYFSVSIVNYLCLKFNYLFILVNKDVSGHAISVV